MTSKKLSLLIFLQTLGAIFAQIFRDFAKIFRDFARIFNKSKLLGVPLHPLNPRLLHHWLPPCSVTRQSIFMKIQQHLCHTLVECDTKFSNAAWQLQATILTSRPKKDSNFAFWPSQWRHSAA